jgi:hypothetical protein
MGSLHVKAAPVAPAKPRARGMGWRESFLWFAFWLCVLWFVGTYSMSRSIGDADPRTPEDWAHLSRRTTLGHLATSVHLAASVMGMILTTSALWIGGLIRDRD